MSVSRKIIDVSQAQGKIDWAKVKDQVDFVILRASEGRSMDKCFDYNADRCLALGIPFGVYHFLHALTDEAALTEVKVFYNGAKRYKPAFWCMDVESPGLLYANGKSLPMRTGFAERIRYFYDELRKRVGSAGKIILYAGESVIEPYGHLSTIPWDGLWIPNYGGYNAVKMAHDLRQYSNGGRVSGINTNVDLDRMVGTKDLAWWTGQQPEEPVKPVIDRNGDGKIVEITEPTAWNIREQPDPEGRLTGAVAKVGEQYEYAATAWNGWLGIYLDNGDIGWVTGKAGKVVDA